jgi:hypothetical protein
MNTAEKIAGTYLRLNGFLHLPQFTVFEEDWHTHVDFVALRAPNSYERAGGTTFPVDEKLFKLITTEIESPKTKLLGALVEVRTNATVPLIGHTLYVSRFLGDAPLIRFVVYDTEEDLKLENGVIHLSLGYAVSWILWRVRWMEHEHPGLTKSGSWTWSEEFLADLLVLWRLKFKGQ